MKLTYLIGNGFDLGLGFNTKYSDFVKFISKEFQEYLHPARPGVSDEDRERGNWLLGQIQDHKEDFWSDAELAFGALPFSGCEGNIADVVKYSHDRFLSSMKRWLRGEFERARWLKLDIEDASGVFIIACITGWLVGLTDMQRNKFLNVASQNTIELNFITFNYTTVIERIVSTRRETIFEFDYWQHKLKVKIGTVCHVHGLIPLREMGEPMVFGVNEVNQIKDNVARSDVEVDARLVKTQYQGYTDMGALDEAERIIDNSDYIVSYGLSFGATDKFWWERLYSFICNTEKRLVVCPYIREELGFNNDPVRYKQWTAKRVFKSLGDDVIRDVTRADIISQIVDVKPVKVEESNGDMIPCDYLQLHSIARGLWLS